MRWAWWRHIERACVSGRVGRCGVTRTGWSRRAVVALPGSLCVALTVLALGSATAFASPPSHTQTIDTGNGVNAVSCVPRTTTCVVSDSKGNALYATDVSASASATWTPWSGPAGAPPGYAVACPATSLCALAAGHAEEPGAGGSVYYATSLGGAWTKALEPTYGVDAISCASTSRCVAGQLLGFINYTMMPASGEWFALEKIGSGAITAVDCLTASFCAIVDSTGHLYVANTAAKIDEQAGWKSTDVDGTTALHGIACTSTTSCFGVDSEGNVLDLTINGSGEATVSKHDIDGPNDLTATACTGLACATVDSQGNIFLSADGGGSWTKQYETGTDLTSVSCSSNALCLAGDTTGEVIAFASARVSVEACGGGGGAQPLGGGGYELCALINPDGTTVEACKLEFGTQAGIFTNQADCETSGPSGEEPFEAHARLTGLAPGKTYYARFSARNENGTEFGPEDQFTTELVAPTVTGESVSGLTEDYATLEAQINPGGGATYYAEYGTSACGADTCGTKTSEGFLSGARNEAGSLEVTNLKPNTTYHYWVVAANSAAPAGVHGEAEEFTTPKSWEEIRNEEDEQLFKQRVQEETKSKAEAEARTAAAAKEHQEEEAAPKKKTEAEPPATGGVSLVATSVSVQRNGMALVKLECLGVANCHGKVTLMAKDAVKAKGKQRGRTVTIGTVDFSIAGDETKTVKVKLDIAGRALLGTHNGRLSASLAILELAPRAGNTQTKTVRLVQQKARGGKTKKGSLA